MKKRAVSIGAAVAAVAIALTGVGAYVVAQILTHPPEDTARFLPEETAFYISLNLRPGVDQLTQAVDVLDRFKEDPKFEWKLDEYYDQIEEELGIDVEADLFPWIGPEVSMAIPGFTGFDDVPDVVAFIGATDRAAAEAALRKLVAYAESEGSSFTETQTRGYLTFISEKSDELSPYIVLTDDYMVLATSEELLLDTLDRMEPDATRPTLLDKPGFQEARAAAQSPRFGILYVDLSAMLDGAEGVNVEDFGVLGLAGDQVPDFIVVSAAFFDGGVRFATSFETTHDSLIAPSPNSLASASLAPGDALALVSFVGLREAWEAYTDESLEVDEILDSVEQELGIDIENDILGWMSGELAAAVLLPEGATLGTEEIHANLYVEFDDREAALSGLDNVRILLEGSGLAFSEAYIGGYDAVLVNMGEEGETLGLAPGYVVLDGYVVIGTSEESLRLAVAAGSGDIATLAEAPAFTRPVEAAGGTMDYMVYANVGRIVEELLAGSDERDTEEFDEDVAPFLDPLEAILLSVAAGEDISTYSTVLTIE